jgi:hypothetical protein
VRNTIKKIINAEKKEEKEAKKAEMKMRQNLRKVGEYNEDFKDETIINLVNKYTELIDKDLAQLDKEAIEKEEIKELQKQEKMREREDKRATKKAQIELKKQEKLEKRTIKMREKQEKMREREEKRATKNT